MDTIEKALPPLVAELGERLLACRAMLVTAESCTGGWVAKACTDRPGSSAWFDCGFVTYSNSAKQRLLGVPEALLARHGAVSEAVVQAMVEGALARSAARYGVAVSGIAGPGGGTPDKPTGTVWLAWGAPDGMETVCEHFPGDREQVRVATVARALRGLIERL